MDCDMAQVLVLDGDDWSRKDLCDLLRQLGVKEEDLVCATTDQEAMEILDTGRVGVLIIEASDAIAKGYSICSLLEASPGTKVLVKAYIDELGPIEVAAIRVHGILEKPVHKEELEFFLKKVFKIRTLNKKLDDILQKMSPVNIFSDCPVSCK